MKTSLMFKLLMLGLILVGPVSVLHAQGVSEKDLILYYSFNKDTIKGDEVLDASGNGNDGVIKGNNIDSVKGKVAEGLEFPGAASDYISVRNHMYEDPVEELTITAWVKASGRGMISSWDRSEFFRFAVGDDVGANIGTTFLAFDHCCPIHDWFGDTEVADDEWHHVVAWFDGDEKRVYLDGELDGSIAATTKVIGAGLPRFGFIGIGSEAGAFDAATGPNWAFNGIMDEYLMFHRALSEKEIEHLSQGTQNPFEIDPSGKLSTTWGDIKDIR